MKLWLLSYLVCDSSHIEFQIITSKYLQVGDRAPGNSHVYIPKANKQQHYALSDFALSQQKATAITINVLWL